MAFLVVVALFQYMPSLQTRLNRNNSAGRNLFDSLSIIWFRDMPSFCKSKIEEQILSVKRTQYWWIITTHRFESGTWATRAHMIVQLLGVLEGLYINHLQFMAEHNCHSLIQRCIWGEVELSLPPFFSCRIACILFNPFF